jgi:prevent-host-death family protein
MESIEDLTPLPAADVKKHGWRGVMRTVRREGPVLVTNHGEPEAVIIPADEYSRLVGAVRQADAAADQVLDGLRRRFDARLASLSAPDAASRLRSVTRRPPRLEGKVKAGRG